MRAIHHKLGRDLLGSLGTLLTVVVIIAVGTGSLIGLSSAQRILETSQRAYYREYRFGDFWIDIKKAPLDVVERIAELPGLAAVEARVTFDVMLDVPDEIRPVTGRLVSIRGDSGVNGLNRICLLRGSGFSHDRDEEVIVSDTFARRHDLRPGDRLSVVLNRKRESLLIVGTALSPEYVYAVRGQGDLIPDPRHFGVLYVKGRYARDVLDFKDACNQVVGRFHPGVEADGELLLARMERMLEPYGVLVVTPRERHASHRFLTDEIAGLGISATVMPTIFLCVAALVLNLLMTRLAQRQRTIIGTLKAIGYSNRQVMGHYLSYGVVVGTAGGIAGGLVGIGLAALMIDIYKEFFEFPTFVYRVDVDLLLVGMGVSLFFAVAGSAKGVWSVLKLQPAEAMRPKPPERGGAVFLERFPFLWTRLGFRTQIAVRSMARNPVRTATVTVSTALAVSIIFLSLIMYDSSFFLMDFQFEHVAHSDLDLGLRDEESTAALLEARALPGVDTAEPVFGLACELRNGRRARRVGILGLAQGHSLTTPVEPDLTPVVIPPDGLVLSKKLAEVLDVRVGDVLTLEPVRGRREPRSVLVAALVESYLGLECYADLSYLSRIVGEDCAMNSIQLAVHPTRVDSLLRAIHNLPVAQSLSVRTDLQANIAETLVATTVSSLGVLIAFAALIALGAMVNCALIEIGDRVRDISTFRVLGYHPGEVSGIFLRENLVTSTVGLVLALPLGYGLTMAIADAYNTELFRMPVIFRPVTVIAVFAMAVLFVLAAQWFVIRQIRKLDWLDGVKVKE